MVNVGLLLSAAATLVVVAIWQLTKPPHLKRAPNGKQWRMPPGPKAYPIVGNLVYYFKERRAGRLTHYLRELPKYGEMTTLHMGNRTWVVLNSDRVSEAIIAKRGKVTNERPFFPVAGALISENKRTTLQQTEKWKEGRRVMHLLTNTPTLAKYGDWYESETVKLLSSYAKAPERWFIHHSQFAASIIFRLLFGYPYDRSEEELHKAQKVPMEFVHAINNTPVDFFPWLAKIPQKLQFWREYWASMGLRHRYFLHGCFKPAEAQVDAGEGHPSFLRDTLLSADTSFRGDREHAMYVCSSVMGAGTQNTRLTLNTFFMSLISHPEVLARMQAELDNLCTIDGNLRLPKPEDIDSLPYCAATVKELLRWRPTIPIVPQHELTEPLEFEGYYFPPGTDFLVNNVGLQYQGVEDPENFRPERYIDNGNETNMIRNLWAFGGGRRICVGYRVFQLSSWLAFARMVYCFNIVADGKFDTDQMNHPTLDAMPFPVKVVPRSQGHLDLIDEAMKHVNEVN